MTTTLDWFVRTLASAILLWGLSQQFAGTPETVELFTRLGVEPFGRIGTSIIEVVVILLLMIPRTALVGSICGMILMAGAILSHIIILGINKLFFLAIIVLVCCFIAYRIHRSEVKFVVTDPE